jgi:hypothetical protein
VRFEFESGIVSFCFSFTFVSFWKIMFACLMVCRWQVRAWRAATRTVVGVRDLMQRIEDGRTGRILDGQAVERSGGAMCGLHLARGD